MSVKHNAKGFLHFPSINSLLSWQLIYAYYDKCTYYDNLQSIL